MRTTGTQMRSHDSPLRLLTKHCPRKHQTAVLARRMAQSISVCRTGQPGRAFERNSPYLHAQLLQRGSGGLHALPPGTALRHRRRAAAAHIAVPFLTVLRSGAFTYFHVTHHNKKGCLLYLLATLRPGANTL